MRKTALWLAMFFIVITIGRVAFYISLGLHVGWMGWPFAIGLAYAVFETMRWVGRDQTKVQARWAAGFFVSMDLVFNEFEMIRSLSALDLVPPNRSFIGWEADDIRIMMQWTAIAFGAVPTVAVGLLGWLQGGRDKFYAGKPTLWGRFTRAMANVLTGISVKAVVGIETTAIRYGWVGEDQSQNLPMIDGQVTGKKWHELTADDVAFISAN